MSDQKATRDNVLTLYECIGLGSGSRVYRAIWCDKRIRPASEFKGERSSPTDRQ